MKTKCKLLLLLLMCTSFAIAQTGKTEWRTTSAGGYNYKTVIGDPLKARFYTLKNGLTVILSVNKKEPRIQSLMAVRSGSNSDPKDHTGLAHYLEHVMFKGTNKYGTLNWAKEKPLLNRIDSLYENYNHTTDTAARAAIYRDIDKTSGEAAKFAIANEYDKLMSSMGAQGTNASTWYEFTVYTDDVPSNAIDKYLTVQAERFRNPVFRIFHTELEAVYEEKNISLDSDPDKVDELMYATLFPTNNYGQQTTIGTIEHLKNPSLKAIRDFYNKNYVPNNMALVMTGDFDPDYLIKRIDHYLSYMKPGDVSDYNPAPEAPITQAVYKEVLGPDAESVNMAYRLPGGLDFNSFIKMTALKSILSNGKAGLIDIDLNKKQQVLTARASVSSYRLYSLLELTGRPKADQSLEEVKDLLLKEIAKVKAGAFDEKLIKAAAVNYRLSELQGLDNNQNRAYKLFGSFILDRNTSWAQDVSISDVMAKLTKKELVKFANENLEENFACIYKRKGEDKNVIKVSKPPITPVEMNREAQSVFLKQVAAMPATVVKPQWLDYDKDIQKSEIGKAQLLYVQNKDNDIFRQSYRFDMGNFNSKMSSLAAQYLQFLGTSRKDAEEISREFYYLGCSYNINVSDEFTTISLTGLQENMVKANNLLEDLLANCKADEAALVSLKARILKARSDNKLNKRAILTGLRSYAMYGEKNPFNNQYTNDELNELQASDLINFLHNLTKYKHVVIYYGPLTLKDATTAISKVHVLPATFISYPASDKFNKIEQTKNTVLFADYDMVQAEIAWVRNTVNFNPDNASTVEVFNEYYGGSMGSIVFQTLRESKALAYSTYAFYSVPSKEDDKYAVIGYIGTQADKLDEAIAGMNDLFTNVPESQKVLEVSKMSIKNRYQTERYTQDAVIYQYLADQRLGLKKDLRKDVYQNFEKISFSDLQKFANSNISNKPYTYCILASEKRVKPEALSKYGEVKKLRLEEIFGY
ncbi:MAG: insulinase family protein [Ginsengibacter sp.]